MVQSPLNYSHSQTGMLDPGQHCVTSENNRQREHFPLEKLSWPVRFLYSSLGKLLNQKPSIKTPYRQWLPTTDKRKTGFDISKVFVQPDKKKFFRSRNAYSFKLHELKCIIISGREVRGHTHHSRISFDTTNWNLTEVLVPPQPWVQWQIVILL